MVGHWSFKPQHCHRSHTAANEKRLEESQEPWTSTNKNRSPKNGANAAAGWGLKSCRCLDLVNIVQLRRYVADEIPRLHPCGSRSVCRSVGLAGEEPKMYEAEIQFYALFPPLQRFLKPSAILQFVFCRGMLRPYRLFYHRNLSPHFLFETR